MTEADLNAAVRRETLDVLNDLFPLLREKELDALIIPHDDEYLSAALTEDSERLAFLTGFTGSAGAAVITDPLIDLEEDLDPDHPLTAKNLQGGDFEITKRHAVFVDGRYTVQVKEQTDPEIFNAFDLSLVDPCTYLCAILPRASRVGIDLRCISYQTYLKIKKALDADGIELIGLASSLIDEVWDDRPQSKLSQVYIYADEYNGCPSLQKRQALAEAMREKGIDATVICSPETICWLLNIRGSDRKGLPVINCRLVAYANEAVEWYIDRGHLESDGIESDIENHCGHLDIFQENRFEEVLERLCNSKATVYIDPETTNAQILKTLYEGGAEVIEGLGLCEIPKAIKNEVEITNERIAHIKDGIAQCRFLAWLDDLTSLSNTDEDSYQRRVQDVDEAVLAKKAVSLRKVEGEFIEPSFDTISALGSNAAMCHYNHAEAKTPKALGEDQLYLIDSGAHFIEGTTDITRTVLVGPKPSDEMRLAYTLVLKSHIALATTVFPRGTSGQQLDAIARRPLWDHGMDYAHGTGHGVGQLLSVHEGPERISSRGSNIPLEPGMIISIEPGYYKEGEFGIRLENLVVVEPCITPLFSHMLCFSPLTCVPFDKRLIMRDMLTAKEREWLNNYHQHVNEVIQGNGSTLSEMEINWLNEATAAI